LLLVAADADAVLLNVAAVSIIERKIPVPMIGFKYITTNIYEDVYKNIAKEILIE
jgi:hypothetical protein